MTRTDALARLETEQLTPTSDQPSGLYPRPDLIHLLHLIRTAIEDDRRQRRMAH